MRSLAHGLTWCLITVFAFACSTADFGGSSKTSLGRANSGNPARPAASGLDGPGNNSAAATDASSNGTPQGTTGGGTNEEAKNCSVGCCPSQNIAFVDCAGSTPASFKPGAFTITSVSCAQARASADALKNYDTIVYFGAAESNGKAPLGIDTALNNGSKVLAFVPGGSSGLLSGFYSLLFEIAIEFVSNIGGSTVRVQNPSVMSAAFQKQNYNAARISYFMRNSLNTEPLWCSSLVATSAIGLQTTTFHAYLLDSPARHGLLSLTTLTQPNGSTGFDFSEPFLAAQLQQPWNKAGDSQSCGLPCSGGNKGSPFFGDGSNGGNNGGSNGGNNGGNNSNPPPGFSKPGNGFTTATGVGKPVIYLYPTKTQDVTVNLAFDGQFVTTYPSYDNAVGGWRMRANPDGKLFDLRDQREYSYIYWNGNTNAFKPDFNDGFVVKGNESRRFLEEKLAHLGLSPREANDMIVYWLPYLERNPYNLIHFSGEEYTKIARMNITPKPDSLLRVFMVFKRLEKPMPIKAQSLPTFKRYGFTAVEWGGTEIGGSWHLIQ